MESINYTTAELLNIVIENVLKMLWRRNLIYSWEAELEKISDITNNIIIISLLNGSQYYINFINTAITNIASGTQLDEFLSNNVNIHKILIIKSISKKAVKQLYHDYQNIEYFLEHEMYEDIPSKHFIPKHELLNDEQTTELLTYFNENELGKILLYDMMSRYYNAKVGNIFKIIRPSINAGFSIYYRKVIPCSVDILFLNQ